MIFEDVARDLVERVYGGLASVIMGRDGIPLSMYRKEGLELELESLGIEYSNVLAEVNRASGAAGSGEVGEFSILTDKYLVLMRVINPDYFICLVMAPDGNFGKARFMLRINLPKLRSEL